MRNKTSFGLATLFGSLQCIIYFLNMHKKIAHIDGCVLEHLQKFFQELQIILRPFTNKKINTVHNSLANRKIRK
jgi:hypothetical protein